MAANPLKTSIATTTTKAGVADLIVQLAIEGRSEVDRRRSATFLLFGCAYQGCFQYWMFTNLLERLFPGRGLLPALRKVLATNFVLDPCLFYPAFYTIKEALATETLRLDTVRTALANYGDNWKVDVRNNCAFWLPGHAVTYGLCPLHLRMPWVAAMSVGYVGLLSFTRGRHVQREAVK